MDKLEIGIGADGQVRVLAAITTKTVTEGVRRHGTAPTASAAFGRVLTGSALLAASLKDFDRLTVRIDAEGPIKGIVGEADKEGYVRGYVRNPAADAAITEHGKFDVSSIVGGGMFHVIRESGFDVGLRKDPYVGSVPIVSGEIAEDFAHYLLRSEQIPSAVLLGVLINKEEPYVAASGGVMIQMMPGANEHLVTMIEDTIKRAPHLTSVIKDGASPADLAAIVLGEIPLEMIESRSVEFRCGCSDEKAAVLISALGKEEVRSMLTEDRGAVMNCGFCREEFVFNEDQLSAIFARLSE